jgi:hypothetical protein
MRGRTRGLSAPAATPETTGPRVSEDFPAGGNNVSDVSAPSALTDGDAND